MSLLSWLSGLLPLSSEVKVEMRTLTRKALESVNVLDSLNSESKMNDLVNTYYILTPWEGQDFTILHKKLKNRKEYAAFYAAIDLIAGGHFRDPYGVNRTPHGQGVTFKDVFLGNVYGLWTQSVYDWQGSKSLHQMVNIDSGPTCKVVLDAQAESELKYLAPYLNSLRVISQQKFN